MGLENLPPCRGLSLDRSNARSHRWWVARGATEEADRRTPSSMRASTSLAAFPMTSWCWRQIVFVLPTLTTKFGMVTAEALACGTPVVGAPVGATPGSSSRSTRGSWRGVCTRLLSRRRSWKPPVQRQRLPGAVPRLRLDERYSWANVIPRWEAALAAIVRAPAQRTGRARSGARRRIFFQGAGTADELPGGECRLAADRCRLRDCLRLADRRRRTGTCSSSHRGPIDARPSRRPAPRGSSERRRAARGEALFQSGSLPSW